MDQGRLRSWRDWLMFPGFAVTIVGSLLCCGVGIFQCLFSLCITSFGDCARPPRHQETSTAEPREDSEQVKLKSTYFPRSFLPLEN